MVDKSLLFSAMLDDDFQKILQEDAILDKLQRKRYNRSNEFFEYCFLGDGSIKLCGMPIKKLTPKRWSLLWILQNQFTIDSTKVQKKDIDEFFYIMTNEIKSIQEIVESVDFCAKNNINYEEALIDILQLITLTFKPMSMIQTSGYTEMSDEPFYGLPWLIHIGSVVSQMAGVSAEYAIENLSLNTCYYYILESLKEKGVKIMVQTQADINKAIFERTYELANDYYIKVYGKEN